MKMLFALTLAAVLGLAAPLAFADDGTVLKGRPAKIQTAAVTADTGAPRRSSRSR